MMTTNLERAVLPLRFLLMAEIMVVELCCIYLGHLVVYNVLDVSSKNVTWVCNDILKAVGGCPAPRCFSTFAEATLLEPCPYTLV